jgi:DNA-binding transcriptional MerR regulator
MCAAAGDDGEAGRRRRWPDGRGWIRAVPPGGLDDEPWLGGRARPRRGGPAWPVVRSRLSRPQDVVVLLLRDVGFSLAKQTALEASRAVAPDDWQRLARRKLAELDDQIAKALTAREAILHALRCPHEDILECPNFASVVAARLTGQPLHEAHTHEPKLQETAGTEAVSRPTGKSLGTPNI